MERKGEEFAQTGVQAFRRGNFLIFSYALLVSFTLLSISTFSSQRITAHHGLSFFFSTYHYCNGLVH